MSAAPPTPPAAIVIPDPVIGLLATFGPWGLIASVALKYGLPFAEKLIGNIQNNKPVTLDEWNALKAKAALTYDQLPGGV
jgi:hypothetical protein